MKKTRQCPICQSEKLLINARVIDKASKSGPAFVLELAVNKKPNALLFKGEERFSIRAWACADCGYTELYTDNARAAYNIAEGNAYQLAQKKLMYFSLKVFPRLRLNEFVQSSYSSIK